MQELQWNLGWLRISIKNWDKYETELKKRLGLDNKLIKSITEKAKKNPKKVVFAEADNYKILKAAQMASDEGIAYPILLGREDRIRNMIEENGLELGDCEIIDPRSEDQRKQRAEYAEILFE